MGEVVIKLPDVGEGVAEAEIVELHVAVGDMVAEDAPIAAVLTDKATVEVPSPAHGRVAWVGISVGDIVAVGAPIIRIEDGGSASRPRATAEPQQPSHPSPPAAATTPVATSDAHPTGRPLAAPAVRAAARELGVDLADVRGSGPDGRILREDLPSRPTGAWQAPACSADASPADGETIRIVGLRRKIADRVSDAARRIPHFTYVEEVDLTDLEALREELNALKPEGHPRLTILPFLILALVSAVTRFPEMNARFDDEAGIVRRSRPLHLGVATQTDGGLVVPVLRDAQSRSLWDIATEIVRLAEAARAGTATREALSGSTLTVTSLGRLGGIATTPIINAPEVAIVGVNRIAVRPVWRDNAFVPRKVMNLSSSFDHRIVDGWKAAEFIQDVRSLLEAPLRLVMAG